MDTESQRFGFRFLGVEYTGSAFGSWVLDTDFFQFLDIWIYSWALDIWISAFSSDFRHMDIWVLTFGWILDIWILAFGFDFQLDFGYIVFGSWTLDIWVLTFSWALDI
ncbi:hypothetical protein RhiirA5_424926 [Rhizophagus irregularis]|uniref:Uncharacterized protein n=1 Tax=Rhizophagus irregularis TaxID=588596 RepID=A0A2N0P7D4_9GLOM|nr:hypothetical protein RhiirA5_424926 [Rhizophagus irregularis]